ncbi:MAG: alpha/beta hydrolase [Oscillospiraceae bacterium]|nr:alpha/beta hydrolase [Oscillospiraceae bacterium]
MKKLLALAIALSLALLCAVPAGAKTAKEPLIIVNGMGESPLLSPDGARQVWPPASDAIAKAALKVTPLLPLLPVYREGFAKLAYPALRDLFDDIAYLPDGTSKHALGQQRFPDSYAADKTGKIDSVSHGKFARLYGAAVSYQFVIDWRESGAAEAERLDKFIQKVLKETGRKAVKIVAVSMGGGVAMAYLAKYGHRNVSTLVLMHTVFQGIPIVGDMFNQRLTLDGKTLQMFLKQSLKGNEPWRSLVAALLGALRAVGILDPVLDGAEGLVGYMNPELFQELMTPVFAQLPGFWGLVSGPDYESAKALLLDPVTHKGLIAKIDDYHYNVFNQASNLLKAAMKDGVRCYVLSGYNLQGAPIGPNALMHTDDGLATERTSGWATCMPLGEHFPAGYKQKVNDGHNHIDPERMIDASTCFLPEQTWFQRDLHHTNFYSGDGTAFMLWLLESDRLLNVRSDARWPQFVAYDGEEDTLRAIATNQ